MDPRATRENDVFKPVLGSDFIVGVVGALQFEVMADRIRTEYEVPVIFEPTALYTARWITGDKAEVKKFIDANRAAVAYDHDDEPVFLARNAWHLGKAAEDFPLVTLQKTRACIA